MIILVFGLPGSGKTYFSKHLAAEINAIHLNTDKIRHKYNKQGQYDEKSKQYVYDMLKQEMLKTLQQSSEVIVDGTFYKHSKRKQFIEKAREQQQIIKFIEIKANEQTIKQRMKNRKGLSEADYSVYQHIKNMFEPLDSPHLVLWSENNMTTLVEKAKEYIYE